jgi:hypothetical protein
MNNFNRAHRPSPIAHRPSPAKLKNRFPFGRQGGRKIYASFTFILLFFTTIMYDSKAQRCFTSMGLPPNPEVPCSMFTVGEPGRGHCDVPNNNLYTIRVYVHIVRKIDDTGAQSLSAINNALDILVSKFAPAGITFDFAGIDYVEDANNDELYFFEEPEF